MKLKRVDNRKVNNMNEKHFDGYEIIEAAETLRFYVAEGKTLRKARAILKAEEWFSLATILAASKMVKKEMG